MKTISKIALATLCIMAMSLVSNAQINKGSWRIGGSMNLYRSSLNDAIQVRNSFNAGVAPSVAYFIGKNISFGISPGYDHSQYYNSYNLYHNVSKSVSNAVSFNVSLSQYKFLTDQIYLTHYLSTAYEMDFRKIEQHSDFGGDFENNTTAHTFSAVYGIGAGYFITPRLSAQVSLGVLRASSEYEGSKELQANLSLSGLGIGFNYFIRK